MRKTFKKTLLLSICLLGFTAVYSQAVHAESVKDKITGLFSKKDDGEPKPHETLRAPFDTSGQLDNSNKKSLMFLYDKELTGNNDGNILARAHRTDAQMSEWAMAVVTNLLSFDYREAQAHINKYQQHLRKGQGKGGFVRGLVLPWHLKHCIWEKHQQM